VPAPVLILLYLVVTCLPLTLAWGQTLPPRALLDEVASGLGLLALAMLNVEFLQLGRIRLVTRRVGSDVVMRSHQVLARAALVFALLHPFLYVSPRAPQQVWDATRRLTVAHDWVSLWPGIVAWLALAGLVAMALGREAGGYRYEQWRLLHGLGAVIVAGFGVLHAIRAGRYSTDPALTWVWIAFFTVALAALGYVYLLAPLRRWRKPWRVASVTPEADRQWRVVLEPAFDRPFRYHAGQFVWLNLGRNVFSLNENPFSIASAPPAGRNLEFLIKELGDFTRQIGAVAPGTRAWVEGPHGHLTADRFAAAPGIALIGGGVGLAPLLAILRELHANNDPRPRVLLYGNRTAEQIAYRAELDTLAGDGLTEVEYVLSEPPDNWHGATGMVDAALLRRHFGRPDRDGWAARRRCWLPSKTA